MLRRPQVGSDSALLVALPTNIDAVRVDQPQLVDRWRRSVRDTLGRALTEGWQIVDVTRDGWYVLLPSAGR